MGHAHSDVAALSMVCMGQVLRDDINIWDSVACLFIFLTVRVCKMGEYALYDDDSRARPTCSKKMKKQSSC